MNVRLLPLVLLIPLAAQAAVKPIDERRSVDADARIELSNVRGLIKVEAWDQSEVEVAGFLGEGVEGLVIEGDAERLSIRIEYPRGGNGGWFGWWGGERAGDSELRVKLPRGASLDVESVSAEVEVVGVAGEEIGIESVSGSVRLDADPALLEVETVSGAQRLRSAARELRLETVSGSIEVEGQGPDSLRAESVSGDVELRLAGAAGSVSAETVSGDLRLNFAQPVAQRARAESMSGAVEIHLPRASSARLSASSFSGSIHSDAGEVERKAYGPGASLQHVLGNGEADISLESFSGRIRIHLDP